tara:strand:+ start:180869 stop:181345 length:477 start_codon:yes stop_codon:yes gene_type:complete
MQATTIIKGTMVAASITFMMMAASLANAKNVETTEVPILKETLRRGETVTNTMLTEMEMPAKRVSYHTITDKEDIVGMEATRTIRAGIPLKMKQFRETPTVRQGHVAILTYNKSGISLTTEGTVMSDAVAGDFVKVMNNTTNRMITGIVQENGTIAVN